MNQLEYLVLEDRNTIVTTYACGFKDKTVEVNFHGATHALWKLQDQTEKHLAKCKHCRHEAMADYLVTHILGGIPLVDELIEEKVSV